LENRKAENRKQNHCKATGAKVGHKYLWVCQAGRVAEIWTCTGREDLVIRPATTPITTATWQQQYGNTATLQRCNTNTIGNNNLSFDTWRI